MFGCDWQKFSPVSKMFETLGQLTLREFVYLFKFFFVYLYIYLFHWFNYLILIVIILFHLSFTLWCMNSFWFLLIWYSLNRYQSFCLIIYIYIYRWHFFFTLLLGISLNVQFFSLFLSFYFYHRLPRLNQIWGNLE